MACPWFLPLNIVPGSPSASPLGALFTGTCAAEPAFQPDEDLQRTACNQGYAHKLCALAAGSPVDAVRFRIRSHHGGVIEVAWSQERDHNPVAVGVLRLTEVAATADPLRVQARACAEVYLRRKGMNW